MTSPSSCTVLMLAQDEESRIGRPLRALRDHGFPALVVDGGSVDGTVELACSLGAQVEHRPFDNMSNQLNWGLTRIATEYVLVVDADETMSPELASEVRDAIAARVDAAQVPNIDYFAGRWLAHYPQHHLRFFRRDAGHFENEVHQRFVFDIADPKVVTLDAPLAHVSHLDVHGFLDKLNRYTESEQNRDLAPRGSPRWLAARGVAEGAAAFAKWYLMKGGWRDGRQGFVHCAYLGVYRFTLWAKAATIAPDESNEPEAGFAAWRRSRRGA